MAMEVNKYNCKLCFKSFANGRALGGHMRSHFFHLKPPAPAPAPEPPSSSSESESDGYHSGKKSFRLRNPEISFTGDVTVAGDGDGESETELSRNVIVVRRRSKRIRKPGNFFAIPPGAREISGPTLIKTRNQSKHPKKKPNSTTVNESSSIDLPDSVSSISNFSPEEDVAYCLIMLSRDKWIEEHAKPDEHDSDSDSEFLRSKYKCNSCNKVFASYQALGGHKASHKKIKLIHDDDNNNNGNQRSENGSKIEDRIHECPVCYKVFGSGQALGGHKRSHFTAFSSSSSAIITGIKSVSKEKRINLIDLNLPAPIEDDDEIEVSVVSDGEFVKRH